MNPLPLVTLTGTIEPSQQLTYVHLPFDVPVGIERIDVTYEYDAVIDSDPLLQGGNTLDIGLFDARGVDFLKAGYRGWSGSERNHIFVRQETATPGYLPGPIQEGRWFVCLGAYKVAPAGCHYEVCIQLTPSTHSQQVEFLPRYTLNDSRTASHQPDGWYKGELHCHTVNSDGDSTVEEIVRYAEKLGLDFLAITDHNNLTHQLDMKRVETDLVLIPGLEVTTFFGHWNIWGDGDWIDFRIQTETDLTRAIEQARKQGYLVSCNHPRQYGPPWTFTEVGGYQCVEVWNGPWQLLNTECLSFWETRIARGERLTAVGGSDHHLTHTPHIAQLGHPTTFIYSPQAPDATTILDALRAGHAFVTEAPDGPHLYLNANNAMMGDVINRSLDDQLSIKVLVSSGAGSVLEIRGSQGLLSQQDVLNSPFEINLTVSTKATPYVRAQLVDPTNGYVRALTNPIYLTEESAQ